MIAPASTDSADSGIPLGKFVRAWTRLFMASGLLGLHEAALMTRPFNGGVTDIMRLSVRVADSWASAVEQELPEQSKKVYARLDGILDDLFGARTPALETSTHQPDESGELDAPPVKPRST